MTYKDFIIAFRQQVAILSYERRLQLGLTIAKELFPDYQRFFERHGWGNPDLLAEGLALAELSTANEIDPQTAKTLAAEVFGITPDTEDFGEVDGSYALNAAVCVVELLTYIADKDPKISTSQSEYDDVGSD